MERTLKHASSLFEYNEHENRVSNQTAIQVIVNGVERSAFEGQTLLELLRSLGIDPQRVAIEMDRQIVKSTDWSTTTIHGGAGLEIVQFVGGG
jgi:sulfur carrier protein